MKYAILIKHFSLFMLLSLIHPPLENLLVLEIPICWPFNSSITFIQSIFTSPPYTLVPSFTSNSPDQGSVWATWLVSSSLVMKRCWLCSGSILRIWILSTFWIYKPSLLWLLHTFIQIHGQISEYWPSVNLWYFYVYMLGQITILFYIFLQYIFAIFMDHDQKLWLSLENVFQTRFAQSPRFLWWGLFHGVSGHSLFLASRVIS